MIAQKAKKEDLRDVLAMVRNTSNPQVKYSALRSSGPSLAARARAPMMEDFKPCLCMATGERRLTTKGLLVVCHLSSVRLSTNKGASRDSSLPTLCSRPAKLSHVCAGRQTNSQSSGCIPSNSRWRIALSALKTYQKKTRHAVVAPTPT